MEKKKNTYAPGTIRAGYSYELDTVVGNLTHMAVGKTLSERMEGESPDFPVVLLENARSLLDSFGQLGPHKSRVLMRVATMSCAYFNRYLPGPVWRFLGAEIKIDGGRVDLAWVDDAGQVFFDELKTTRHGQSMSKDDNEQVSKYVASGRDRLGAGFLGVRFIPLMFPASAILATPSTGSGAFNSCLLSTSVLGLDRLREAA